MTLIVTHNGHMDAEWGGRRGNWDTLSSSERRIVELVCEGLTNPQIGDRLYISRRTVQTHLYNIFKKLGVTSRAELAAKAIDRGFAASSEHAERPR